jgi:hypothetical protein
LYHNSHSPPSAPGLHLSPAPDRQSEICNLKSAIRTAAPTPTAGMRLTPKSGQTKPRIEPLRSRARRIRSAARQIGSNGATEFPEFQPGDGDAEDGDGQKNGKQRLVERNSFRSSSRKGSTKVRAYRNPGLRFPSGWRRPLSSSFFCHSSFCHPPTADSPPHPKKPATAAFQLAILNRSWLLNPSPLPAPSPSPAPRT